MQQFIMGAMTMACWIAALFFLRFWRDSRDLLFAMFAAAFLLLGLSRFALAVSRESTEENAFPYWIRLAAFLLILVAIINKNRR